MHSATHTLHRQPALRSIPSPQQAMWILLARSARLCSAGGARWWAAIYKNQQQFKPRPARTAPTPINGDTAVQSAASSTWQTDAWSHMTLGRQKFLNLHAVSKLVLTFLFILIVYSQVSAYAFCQVLIKKWLIDWLVLTMSLISCLF